MAISVTPSCPVLIETQDKHMRTMRTLDWILHCADLCSIRVLSKSNKTSSYDSMLCFDISFDDNYQLIGSKSNKTSSYDLMPFFRKPHEKTEMAWLVIIIFLFLLPSGVSGKDWPGLAIGLWSIFVSFRCSDANQTPEKNLRENSRSIYKTSCFVAGILKSPDSIGEQNYCNEVPWMCMGQLGDSVDGELRLPAEMTPAVT